MDLTADHIPFDRVTIDTRPAPLDQRPGPVLMGDILNAPAGQPDLIRYWLKDWERLNR